MSTPEYPVRSRLLRASLCCAVVRPACGPVRPAAVGASTAAVLPEYSRQLYYRSTHGSCTTGVLTAAVLPEYSRLPLLEQPSTHPRGSNRSTHSARCVSHRRRRRTRRVPPGQYPLRRCPDSPPCGSTPGSAPAVADWEYRLEYPSRVPAEPVPTATHFLRCRPMREYSEYRMAAHAVRPLLVLGVLTLPAQPSPRPTLRGGAVRCLRGTPCEGVRRAVPHGPRIPAARATSTRSTQTPCEGVRRAVPHGPLTAAAPNGVGDARAAVTEARPCAVPSQYPLLYTEARPCAVPTQYPRCEPRLGPVPYPHST